MKRTVLTTLCVLATTLALSAQITQDFESNASPESITATATGTTLIGQPTALPLANQYNIPVAGSSPFSAYTYAGNTLGVPTNPTGGSQFVSGSSGPVLNQFARAQRNAVPYVGSGIWTYAFDVCGSYLGVLPTAPNLGSFSAATYAATATNRTFIGLLAWSNVATGTAWNINYVGFTAAGAAQANTLIPDPNFNNLATNTWYRWETDYDWTTNQLVACRITNISVPGSCTFTHNFPAGTVYCGGGTTPLSPPTGFRFFAGGAIGNTSSWDNLAIGAQGSLPIDWDTNTADSHLTFDGVTGTGQTGANTTVLANTPVAIVIDGLPFALSEVAVDFAPTVPLCAGGALAGPGVILNLNLANFSSWIWLFGGAAPSLTPFPGIINGSFTPTSAGTISAQAAHFSPSFPGGFVLSQAARLTVQ